MNSTTGNRKVTYLVGAGGSHACVKALGSPHGILMRDLMQDLVNHVSALVHEEDRYHPMRAMVNQIISDDVDIEHIIERTC